MSVHCYWTPLMCTLPCLCSGALRLALYTAMSLGYAEKLSFREDLGGQLGAPELFDTPQEVQEKVDHFAQLVSAVEWAGRCRASATAA